MDNFMFILQHWSLGNRRKILYALLPPPWIRNAGDQAQVVAIQDWLDHHFPDQPRLDLDQDQVIHLLPALGYLLNPDDVIVLHSGGNLGDRYMSTEGARRQLIQKFPHNRIISLPQTIYFTETDHGAMQRLKTQAIYQNHRHLTVLCRDVYSAHLADNLFPQTPTFCIPDFVLSLPLRNHPRNLEGSILLCLRHDSDIESAFLKEDKAQLFAKFKGRAKLIDIRREAPVSPQERRDFVEATLVEFEQAAVIVTDRFHGLIFAIICQRPCVALPSIGHKMTFGIRWFRDLPWVKWADNLEAVPKLVEALLAPQDTPTKDWNQCYFNVLPAVLGFRDLTTWTEASRLYPTDRSIQSSPWQCDPHYQMPEEVVCSSSDLQFNSPNTSTDQWCYVYLDPNTYPWSDISWQMEVQKQTDFRELAFNFRYQDFDHRYRYRFEAGRVFFDRRIRGVWDNNLGSVPFPMEIGTWYHIKIQARGPEFRLEVNGEFLMRNFDEDLTHGSICLILWETDGTTDLRAKIKDLEVIQVI
jgi:pyruvyl transferase EpsI